MEAHLSKDQANLCSNMLWFCPVGFHPSFEYALYAHTRQHAYKIVLSLYPCRFHFIWLSLQDSVLVDQRERIWRELAMCKWSQKTRRQTGVECLSIDQVSTWPIVLCPLCLIWLWGLEDVTWLPNFSVLVLKLGLVIIVTDLLWRCNWVRKCLCPCLVLMKAQSMKTIIILKDQGTGFGV